MCTVKEGYELLKEYLFDRLCFALGWSYVGKKTTCGGKRTYCSLSFVLFLFCDLLYKNFGSYLIINLKGSVYCVLIQLYVGLVSVFISQFVLISFFMNNFPESTCRLNKPYRARFFFSFLVS